MNQRSGWQQPAAEWKVPPRRQQQQHQQQELGPAAGCNASSAGRAAAGELPLWRADPEPGHCYRASAPISAPIRPEARLGSLDSPPYQEADRVRPARFVVHRKRPVSSGGPFDEGAAATHRIDIGPAYATHLNEPARYLGPYRENGLNNNDDNNNNNNNLPLDCLARPLAEAQMNGTEYDWPACDRSLSQPQPNAIILDSPRCSLAGLELSETPRRRGTYELAATNGNLDEEQLAIAASCACLECRQQQRPAEPLLLREGNSFSDEDDFCCPIAESPDRELRLRSLEANHRNWRAHSTMSTPAGLQPRDRLDGDPLGEQLIERLVFASPPPPPPLVVMRHPSQHQLRPLTADTRPAPRSGERRQPHWSLPPSPVTSGANGGGARPWPAHHYEPHRQPQAGIVRPVASHHHQGHLSSRWRNGPNNNDPPRADENYAPASSSNHANDWEPAAGWPNERDYSEQDQDDDDDDLETETETEALALVPKQAKGRLPLSVAEQMSEQAAKFVQKHPNCQPAPPHGAAGFKQPGRRLSSQSRSLATDSNGRTSADWTTGVRSNLQVRRTFRVKVRKSRPILGIAIEGGFNVSGQLIPRIVCVHEKGAAYQCGKLRASDLILEVNGVSTVNMTHDAIASTIATAYYQDESPFIEFLVGESVQVRGACNDCQDTS